MSFSNMEDFPSCHSSGFTPNLGSPYPGRRLFLLPRLMQKSFDFCQEPNRKSQICKLAYILQLFLFIYYSTISERIQTYWKLWQKLV